MSLTVYVYNGSANTQVIKIKPEVDADDLAKLPLIDGYLDFSSLAFDRFVFAVNNDYISTGTESLKVNKNELELEHGDLSLDEGPHDDGLLLIYVVGKPDPIVAAGTGLPSSFRLLVSDMPTIT